MEIVLELIELALKGRLTLTQLYSSWPKDLEGHSLFENIYDDVESAIEHFPGKFFSDPVDQFEKSVDYKVLLLDRTMLLKFGANIDDNMLKKIHDIRKNARRMTVAEIEFGMDQINDGEKEP